MNNNQSHSFLTVPFGTLKILNLPANSSDKNINHFWLSLIITTYNEAANIEQILNLLSQMLEEYIPDKYLTFHGIWKTSLLHLSPFRRETLNFPSTLVGKGVRFFMAFPHNVKSQDKYELIVVDDNSPVINGAISST